MSIYLEFDIEVKGYDFNINLGEAKWDSVSPPRRACIPRHFFAQNRYFIGTKNWELRRKIIAQSVIRKWTFLLRGPSNSQKNTACHVPSFNCPS